MKNRANSALALALAIVGGMAAGMRCDASVTVEKPPTQINPRPAAYTVKAYTEGSDPFVPAKMSRSEPVNLSIITKICNALSCHVGDVVDCVPRQKVKKD